MAEERLFVQRYEDMSPDGKLRMFRQSDGDIILAILPSKDTRSSIPSVEFCSPGSGGGQSPKTHAALRALYEAMVQDEENRQQYREI